MERARLVKPFYLLLVTYFGLVNVTTSSGPSLSNPLLQQDVGCGMVNCGHGNCKASSSDSMLGYDCECHNGWKKFKIGHLIFPSCVIPNCTFDFQCFNGSQRPRSHLRPPLNFSDPCALIWCGHNGKCVTNGTRYSCQCFEGSSNLLNSISLPCFETCYLGANCNNVIGGLIGPPVISPPLTPVPHHIYNDSITNGSDGNVSCLRIIHAVTLMLIAVALNLKLNKLI